MLYALILAVLSAALVFGITAMFVKNTRTQG